MMTTADCRSEELSHTAEIGFRVWAPSLAALFTCAARTLFALILTGDPADGGAYATAPIPPPATRRQVVVATPDLESLLVEWLNELLYLHEASGALVQVESIAALEARPDGAHIEAIAAELTAPHAPRLHVKAVTYHQLRVTPDDHGWRAEVFLDI
jgi:SHS2 domain-containing protein